MIRRFFSVLICMVFLVTLAYGEETGEEYTLPVKFQKQIALGSGLKGIAQYQRKKTDKAGQKPRFMAMEKKSILAVICFREQYMN